jgi:hypothetical protein
VVEVEDAAKTSSAIDGLREVPVILRSLVDLVTKILVIPSHMVAIDVSKQRAAKHRRDYWDDPRQAFFFDRAHESLCVGVLSESLADPM